MLARASMRIGPPPSVVMALRPRVIVRQPRRLLSSSSSGAESTGAFSAAKKVFKKHPMLLNIVSSGVIGLSGESAPRATHPAGRRNSGGKCPPSGISPVRAVPS